MTDPRMSIEQLDEILRETECVLQSVPDSQRWLESVRVQRRQLQNREYLVAVFGAFSAGKSSLINAFIGQPALVVSPHPTTAAITHVRGAGPMGLADPVVTAKTQDQIWTDVEQALRQLHLQAASLSGAFAAAASVDPARLAPSARRYAAFLRAAAAGYPEVAARLGTSWPVGSSELRTVTADERIACYIQQVELAVPSRFLEQTGIVLVDTPGVDSIHRRHTDVAFEYMRQADAILFVLYYTHAFSRADKEFLEQLAGVQGVVGSDKLFVVINAVDLATDAEERAAVRERVVAELRGLGFPRARIYEVSSQLGMLALRAARDGVDPDRLSRFTSLGAQSADPESLLAASGIPRLQEELAEYVQTEAGRLAADAVHRRLATIAAEVWRGLRARQAAASQDEAGRAAQREAATRFRADLQLFQQALGDRTSAPHRALGAEWDELIYHIGERVRLGLPALFKECFHPGRFRVPGQERVQLQDAAAELVEHIARRSEAELRTFSLRAHDQAGRELRRVLSDWEARLERENLGCDWSPTEGLEGDAPLLPERVNLSWDVIRPAFRHFASAKQFFEGGGQQSMLAAVESVLLPLVNGLIAERAAHVCEDLFERLFTALNQAAEALLDALQKVGQIESGADSAHVAWQAAAQWLEPWLHSK